MAAMKQRVKNVKGSEYFPYQLYMGQSGLGLGLRTGRLVTGRPAAD